MLPGLPADVTAMSSKVTFLTYGVPFGTIGLPEYVRPSANASKFALGEAGYIQGVGPTGPTRIRRTVMFSIDPGKYSWDLNLNAHGTVFESKRVSPTTESSNKIS